MCHLYTLYAYAFFLICLFSFDAGHKQMDSIETRLPLPYQVHGYVLIMNILSYSIHSSSSSTSSSPSSTVPSRPRCAHRFGFSDPRVRLAAVSVGVMRRSTSVARLLHHRGRGIAVPGSLVRVCSCIPAHCRSCCSLLGGTRSPARRWHGVGLPVSSSSCDVSCTVPVVLQPRWRGVRRGHTPIWP